MAVQRIGIKNLVRRYINESAESFWLDADINSDIELAQPLVARRIRWPKNSGRLALTSGIATVSLPSDWLMMDDRKKRGGKASVLFYSIVGSTSGTFVELDPRQASVVGEATIQNATNGSTWLYWYPDGVDSSGIPKIGIHPKPVVSVTSGLLVNYISKPTAFSNDSSVNEISEIAYEATALYVSRQCFLKQGNGTNANTYWQLYNDECERLKNDVVEMFQVDDRVEPVKAVR